MSIITSDYLDTHAREEILDLMDGDAEMIIDLIETLMESSPELMKDLEEGVVAKDSDQVKEAAHALKSSNAQLGALSFADLCLEMENMGKESDLTNVDRVYEAIQQEYSKVEQALSSWKEELGIE